MTLPPSYFDGMYAGSDDPWGFRDRWYETRKRAVTMAALPRPRFRRGFEPGCSIGVLSDELARRCDALVCSDVAAGAVDAAAARLALEPQVEVRLLAVPEQWPEGRFDLVVLSEVGYYLDDEALARLVERTVDCLDDDGVVLACHWRHPVADYPQTGDDVHAALGAASALERTVRHVEPDFVLEVFGRRPARSVAQETGLVGGGG